MEKIINDMEREIKFRAWHSEEKIMSYEFELGDDWIVFPGGEFGAHPLSEYCKVMQLTGLRDKNGKEIYEGDILLFHDFYGGKFHAYAGEWVEDHEDLIGPVIFDDCSFCIDAGSQTIINDFIPLDQIKDHINFEVVGNIYENTELLS